MSPVDSVLAILAALGASLLVLKLRWGGWLLLPAATRFVAWPALCAVVPLLPLWADLGILLFVPVLIVVLSMRAGLDVLAGIYGRDVSTRVVSHAIISMFRRLLGNSGRDRRGAHPDPILPRPGVAEFAFDDPSPLHGEPDHGSRNRAEERL
jgi:hypothetical protein